MNHQMPRRTVSSTWNMNATTLVLLLLLVILDASVPFTDALVVGIADASRMSKLSSTALLISTSISSLPPVIIPLFFIHNAARQCPRWQQRRCLGCLSHWLCQIPTPNRTRSCQISKWLGCGLSHYPTRWINRTLPRNLGQCSRRGTIKLGTNASMLSNYYNREWYNQMQCQSTTKKDCWHWPENHMQHCWHIPWQLPTRLARRQPFGPISWRAVFWQDQPPCSAHPQLSSRQGFNKPDKETKTRSRLERLLPRELMSIHCSK